LAGERDSSPLQLAARPTVSEPGIGKFCQRSHSGGCDVVLTRPRLRAGSVHPVTVVTEPHREGGGTFWTGAVGGNLGAQLPRPASPRTATPPPSTLRTVTTRSTPLRPPDAFKQIRSRDAVITVVRADNEPPAVRHPDSMLALLWPGQVWPNVQPDGCRYC
jgi:hypothetical protein